MQHTHKGEYKVALSVSSFWLTSEPQQWKYILSICWTLLGEPNIYFVLIHRVGREAKRNLLTPLVSLHYVCFVLKPRGKKCRWFYNLRHAVVSFCSGSWENGNLGWFWHFHSPDFSLIFQELLIESLILWMLFLKNFKWGTQRCYFYRLSCLAGSFLHYSLNPQVIKNWWQAWDRKGLHFIQNPSFAPLLPVSSPQIILLCKLWVIHSLVPCTYLIIISYTSFNGKFRDGTFDHNRN